MEQRLGAKKEDKRVTYSKKVMREALLRLLESKPIEKISVSELCREAGINRGTFYSHYEDACGLRRDMEEELVLAMRLRAQELGKKRLSTEESLRIMAERRELCGVFAGPYGDSEALLRITAEQTNDYLASEEPFFASLDKGLARRLRVLMISSVTTAIRLWLDSGMRDSPEAVAAAVRTYCLNGLSGFKSENHQNN